MAETQDETPRVSRRVWLAGLGGGLLSVPLLWPLGAPERVQRPARSRATPPASFVDHDGWMLTAEDVAALSARPAGE